MGNRLQKELYRLLYVPDAPGFFWVGDILALAALLSVLAYVLETTPGFGSIAPYARTIEWAAVLVFALEYAGRVVAQGRYPMRYILSSVGIIDLMAIMPTLLGIGNLTMFKALRTMRIIRLLRLTHTREILRIRNPWETHHDLDHHTHHFFREHGYYFAILAVPIALLAVTLYTLHYPEGDEHSATAVGMLVVRFLIGGETYVEPPSLLVSVQLAALRFFSLLSFGLCVSLALHAIRRRTLATRGA